jgi:SAM-dependent methyltransferase
MAAGPRLEVTALYDSIGLNYRDLRRPDPRIAEAILAALGDAQTVMNIGAGTGSYEPTDRQVTAVEPSIEMIRKRKPDAAPAVQASADALPFADKAFDAAMAVLTIHHWPDKAAGLREVRRVTKGRIILLTYDPAHRPWLTDYLPELAKLDEAQMPKMSDYEAWLGPVQVTPVPVPHDCSDGFLYAYWKRPQAYLDPHIRSGSSSFWALGDVTPQLDQLAHDLKTGEWHRRYADKLARDDYDAGYRLVVSER